MADDKNLPAVMRLVGESPRPTLAVLGGIHGDEIEGVLATRTLVGVLGPKHLRGSVAWAAPAHPATWAADSRTGPDDGMNLARVFPGNSHGTPTERVAALLTTVLIEGTGLLIDLHSGGRGFDVPLLAGFQSNGPFARSSEEAARAFGAPLRWAHSTASPGRSLLAAASLAVPSFYVEGRGGGGLRRCDLRSCVHGVLRVMAHMGMLDIRGLKLPPPPPVTALTGDRNTDEGITSPADGFFVTAAGAGCRVHAAGSLGAICDQDGATTATIASPVTGVVTLLRRSAKVRHGDTLAIVGEIVDPEPGAAAGGPDR